ncbi:MAG: hypothetical protein OXJ53_03390 [Gammaproteobacteria bacterium]|nr:hypothetical protein [Gammaproteobacteria bacterium]MDE0273406.1 hypothetical protein [Gammaproteobacteria bacterium]
MKKPAAVLGGMLLLSLPLLVQSQEADGTEPEPAGKVLCFQVEALFVRAQDQAGELKAAYDRICPTPSATGDACRDMLRQQHGKELDRLRRYRRWGNALREDYGSMCGGALNETLKIIVEALDYVSASQARQAGT